MGRPTKSDAQDLRTAVKAAAWKIIGTSGIEAVALRAIARDLNITAPAIYNYYPSRDELIQALVADADADLGAYLTDAHAPHLQDDPGVRFRVVCQAYRRWAVENPQRYQLFFSAPPAAVTSASISHTLEALIAILDSAQKEGGLKKDEQLVLPPGLSKLLTEWKTRITAENEYTLYLATIIWSRLHGLILNEIGGRFPPFIKDAGELYRLEVKTMITQYLSL